MEKREKSQQKNVRYARVNPGATCIQRLHAIHRAIVAGSLIKVTKYSKVMIFKNILISMERDYTFLPS